VKFPVLDTAGEPYAVCGISTDITDRKRAEDEVRRLNASLETRVRQRTAELEASTKELDAFAYSVSHDLRAPLRSLHGFSDALLEDYGDIIDDVGKDYLHRLQRNVGRMGRMIDDLLNLSRATRAELDRCQVDLSAMCQDVVADLQAGDPDRVATLVVPAGLTADADPHLLRLALQNLLANAWKFTSKRDEAVIEVGRTVRSGETFFFVRDNGVGFDMTYAGKLFDAFQRLHTTSDFEGTGIGLAIVARVVRRHGGRIFAEAEADRGATFYFNLMSGAQGKP
jgi:light-regulated signal transduction histidine kinase (bacteriophytochrome)